MVEVLVSARKALEPTSYPRLQDFLDALQSFEAYLRFQPALIFPLAASRQLRRALTIRYRDSSVDSNIPGTTSIKAAPRANVASIIIRFYIDAGKPSKGPSRRALKSVVQEGGPARHRDGGCGLGDSDRRWAPLPPGGRSQTIRYGNPI